MICLRIISSVISMVMQNILFNNVSKKRLSTNADAYSFNFVMHAVCFIIFTVMAVRSEVSLYTLCMGLIFGFVTAIYIANQTLALSCGPMHITLLITTSSMIIPALSGVVLFHESFSALKLAAIVFLIGFIYLSADSRSGGHAPNKRWLVACLLAFLFQGAVGVMQKLHQSSIHKDETAGFLAAAFFCSLVISALLSRSGNRTVKPDRGFIIPALACGLCSFVMNHLNLMLSGMLPSQLFFPLINGSSIILSSLCSVFLFKESLTRRQTVGLVGGIAALIGICVLP